MARFFKFIFNILLIAYIAIALALLVPPLVGFTTATVMEGTSGNQTVGTVDYAKRIPLAEVNVGERILVTGSNTVNVYTIQAVDTEKSVVTVADTENQEIPVRSYVYRMVLAVPFIGYVLIALQTMEGIIVLAMIAVLLVLLCILTGIWSKKAKEKRRRKKEMKAEKAEAAKKEAVQAAEIERAEVQNTAQENPVFNARAEAYFAARQAEANRLAPDEEYEDFPPKAAAAAEPVRSTAGTVAQKAKPVEMDYFDDEEDNEDADSWLHDDVDDDELYAGLNSKAASESLMATARLFAINRAAQAKENMAANDSQEALDATRVISSNSPVQAKQSAVLRTEVKASDLQKKTPAKEIVVDKVVDLRELKEMDAEAQQIVLTINIKVLAD